MKKISLYNSLIKYPAQKIGDSSDSVKIFSVMPKCGLLFPHS